MNEPCNSADPHGPIRRTPAVIHRALEGIMQNSEDEVLQFTGIQCEKIIILY